MISWTWYFIYDHSFDDRLWWVKPPSSHQCCSQSATFLHHSQPYVHNWWWWCLLSQALYHPSHHARTWSNHLCFDLWRSITWPILYGSLAYQGAQNAPFDSTTTTVILEYKSALCLRLLEISIYKPQARLVDNTGTSSASPAKEWSKAVHTLINAFIIPTPTCKGCYQSSATKTKPILSIIEQ